jgi:membrane-associated phospholipid phosphatase
VHPRRFRALLPVAIAIVWSTLVLRYHYAVDVLAGVLWFALFRAVFPRIREHWNRVAPVTAVSMRPPPLS